MIEKYAFWIKVLQFANFSPIFKGSATIIVGVLALLFALWMRKPSHQMVQGKCFKEPATIFYKIFVGLCIFIIAYGSYILIIRPNWWALPY